MSRGFSFGESQTLECLLVALNGQTARARVCRLLDQQRTKGCAGARSLGSD